MYLSQLILNPRSRQVRSELARPYELHRTVMSAFRPMIVGERVLYRLDLEAKDGIPRILVQSRGQPDWSDLQSKNSYFLQTPQTHLYDPYLQTGQHLAFRLLANPTRATKEGVAAGERGKRVSIGSTEGQIAWLKRKAAAGGFEMHTVRLTTYGPQHIQIEQKTKNAPMHHWAVRFDGDLEVTDPAVFRQTLANGIGSAKGFGYGLLSIARI